MLENQIAATRLIQTQPAIDLGDRVEQQAHPHPHHLNPGPIIHRLVQRQRVLPRSDPLHRGRFQHLDLGRAMRRTHMLDIS